MAIRLRKSNMSLDLNVTLLLILSMFCLKGVFVAGRRALHGKERSSKVFNVKSFGAQADGRTDDSQAFLAAWKEACESEGRVEVVVPKGMYMVGPVKFDGPCQNVSSIIVRMKGYLKASTNLSKYESGGGWVEFRWLKGLMLTGGGTFDGQGAQAWPSNNCLNDSKCGILPTNVKFVGVNNTILRRITSKNSKFFHMALVECHDLRGSRIEIAAPGDSPNTDGIHIDRSSSVHIDRSRIGTGDDCVSIGQGNSQISISRITCGPGHGISVGGLGKYPNERDVTGLVVRDCYMTGTTNGIRIKTWPNSPGKSAATNMTFDNIIMNNVRNPIIIDQSYCPSSSCYSKVPSRVKLSDIHFKNIRGTSSSEVAVSLGCSEGIPCENVCLEDVHLDLSSRDNLRRSISFCRNVRAKFIGTQVPPPCS